MTGLLVSVRNALEAEFAARGGANIIDVKEPARGPLGCADAQTLRSICDAIGQRIPLSDALGEIVEPPAATTLHSLVGYRYAKIGLAGAMGTPHWQHVWQELVAQFPTHTQPVAVIYADWRHCRAPPRDAILDLAQTCRCAAVLVDTFNKASGNLFSWMSFREIHRIARCVERLGMGFVLAGSLRLDDFGGAVRRYRPWLLAVRGAACPNGRAGSVSPQRVAVLARRLQQVSVVERDESCPTDGLKCAAQINRDSGE